MQLGKHGLDYEAHGPTGATVPTAYSAVDMPRSAAARTRPVERGKKRARNERNLVMRPSQRPESATHGRAGSACGRHASCGQRVEVYDPNRLPMPISPLGATLLTSARWCSARFPQTVDPASGARRCGVWLTCRGPCPTCTPMSASGHGHAAAT